MKKPNAATCFFILLGSLIIFSGCSGDDLSTFLGGGESTRKYSLQGTVSAADNSAMDSDVNDILAPFAPNDDFETAQKLPNPAVLGGYVNITGSGEPGRFYDPDDPDVPGDSNDFFTVRLTENQSITLYLADYVDDFSEIDIDLYLYDENKGLVQAPERTGPFEIVTAAAAGTYFIHVSAKIGASNYILTVGRPAVEATLLDERLQDEFIPGDIIVSFEEDMPSFGNTRQALKSSTAFGMALKAGAHGPAQVFELNSQNRQQVFAFLGIQPSGMNRRLYRTEDETTQLKLDTLRVIQALKKKPGIRYAEPNYIRHALFVPNDTYYGRQWHYPLINLPQAWDITQGSTEVVVAVVDTGILSSHPDIDSLRLTGGYDFISDPSIARDGDGIDPDPEDPGDDLQGGSSFHGTHVAGTIAAATDNSTGVAGVAPNVKIMPLRVLGKGGGTSADIIEALKYAAGLANDSGTLPGRKADILNMSLGGPSWSQAEQDAINAVREEGVILVAAAGNSSSSLPSYPAAYDGVVSVSAVDAAKNLAPYSNYGGSIDTAAPGGNFSEDLNGDGYGDGVLSTGGDDDAEDIQYVYSFSSGTSMAAPHLAGVAALMKSVYPALKPADLDMLLAEGLITQDIGGPGRDDQYGHGLIDAYKAVAAVQDGIASALLVNPSSLNFKASLAVLSITAEKIGTDSDTILKPPLSDADWLRITPERVADDGFGTYGVAVDRTGLPDGPYYAALFFDSDQNDVEVPVTMEVGNTTVAGNSGYHYILLLDAVTFEGIDQAEVAAIGGRYPFTFHNVPSGRYIVFAGTDSDNDYFIGDSGEAVGAYISLDQPSVITVDDHVDGLDFTTAFNLNLPAGTSALKADAFFPVWRAGIKACDE